jgi:LysM repeat protein
VVRYGGEAKETRRDEQRHEQEGKNKGTNKGTNKKERVHMAAVMTMPRPELGPVATPTAPRVSTRPVARRGARTSAATFWRRRLIAGAVGLAVLVMAGKAGAALGGSPLAVPERGPAITQHVVQPGDSLWSIAEQLEPGRDPRPVVDALTAARGGKPLVPGEVVRWTP